jgi:hypothetical protein
MLAALKNAVPDIAKVAGLAPGVVTRAAIVRDASKLKRVVDSAEKVAKAAKANKSLVKELVRKELTGEKDKLRNLLLSFNQHRRSSFLLSVITSLLQKFFPRSVGVLLCYILNFSH